MTTPRYPKKACAAGFQVRGVATPWSRESAFYVFLPFGLVSSYRRNYSGFGLACRRARQ